MCVMLTYQARKLKKSEKHELTMSYMFLNVEINHSALIDFVLQ